MSTDPQVGAQQNGRTFADFFESLLTSPRRLGAFVVFLLALLGIAIFAMLIFKHLFGVSTSEVRLGTSDTHILFSKTDAQSGDREYTLVVSPQGWQPAHIEVQTGEHVTFSSGGKICIDVSDILKKVEARLSLEEKIIAEQHIRVDDSNESRTPEDFFTAEQAKSLKLERPWVGPDGFSLDRFKPSILPRRQRYLLPKANAGSLLAGIGDDTDEGDKPPATSDVFLVGRSLNETLKKTGRLWFTVNDVQYKTTDPELRNLFYNDNIGQFWVSVKITHK